MKKKPDAVILLGHGSRVVEANFPLGEIALLLEEKLGCKVKSAFLQLAQPGMEEAVKELADEGYTEIAVAPFFLFPGAHVREDIPELVEKLAGQYPDIKLILAPHLGVHPLMADVIVKRLEEVL